MTTESTDNISIRGNTKLKLSKGNVISKNNLV